MPDGLIGRLGLIGRFGNSLTLLNKCLAELTAKGEYTLIFHWLKRKRISFFCVLCCTEIPLDTYA